MRRVERIGSASTRPSAARMSTRSVGNTCTRPRISACACSTDSMRAVYYVVSAIQRSATGVPGALRTFGGLGAMSGPPYSMCRMREVEDRADALHVEATAEHEQ